MFLFSGFRKRLTSLFLSFTLALTAIPFVPPVALSNCGNPCGGSSVASSLSSKPGGVALDKTAQFLEGFESITGATYNENTGHLVFMGQKNTDLVQEINKDDLAVVVRSIFNNTFPTVSIDPNPNNQNEMLVRFDGNIENTNVGKVLYEADRVLKITSLGKDNETGQAVNPPVPGYKSVLNRYVELNDPTPGQGQSRMWLVPKVIEVKKSADMESFVFGETSMELKYENMGAPDPEWDQANQAFIDHFNQHYQEFAQIYPEFQKANEIAKLVGVVRWIKENNIPIDLNWLLNYKISDIQTPNTVPSTTVSATTRTVTVTITGGVALTQPNTYQNDTGAADAWRGEAISQQPSETTPDWDFTYQNDPNKMAVAVSLLQTKKNGAYTTQATDFNIPGRGKIPLELTRYYSSFETMDGPMGYGWIFLPKALYFPNLNDIYNGTINGQTGIFPMNIELHDDENGGNIKFSLYTNGYFPDEIDNGYQLFKNADGTYALIEKERTKYNFNGIGRLTSVVDQNGNATTYTWMTDKLTQITDSAGRFLNLTYDGNHLDYITDSAGRVVNYTYDALGNLSEVADPQGNSVNYSYDSDHRLASATDKNGIVTVQNTYDFFGRVTRQTDAKGNYFDTNYNIFDTVTNATGNKELVFKGEVGAVDNNGYTTTRKYDEEWRLKTEIDPQDKTTSYAYGSTFIHKPISVTDKKGNTTSYEYDGFGNTYKITDPLGNISTNYFYRYDLMSSVNPKGVITNYYYDANKNLIQIQKGYSNNNTYFTYDQYGNVVSTKDALDRTTTMSYDAYGNPVAITDAKGNTVLQEFDTLSRKTKATDAEGRITSFTYDKNNNLLTKADAAGTTKYEYDQIDKLVKQTDAKDQVTSYSYDVKGNLASVIDSLGSTTAYSYDPYDNLTDIVDANGNRSVFEFNPSWRKKPSAQKTALGKTTTYTYDENDNIVGRIDPSLAATNYEYDALNRLTKVTYPNASTVNYEYDAVGNKTKMTDTTGITAYQYEPVLDFLTQVTDPDGKAVGYGYDLLGNKRFMVYPDNSVAQFSYDDNNQLNGVLDFYGFETLYSYNKAGNVVNQAYPNKTTADYVYDSVGRLASLINKNPNGTTMSSFNYTPDPLGNRTKITQNGADKNFSYDSLSRLSNESFGGSTGKYAYDKTGNRTENSVDLTLVNADFETLNGVGEPKYWSKYGSGVSATTTEGHTSSKGVKFISTTSTYGRYWKNGDIRSSPSNGPVNVEAMRGKRIVFAAKIKTVNMAGYGANPRIDFFTSTGSWIGGYRTAGKTGTSDWNEQGAMVAIPANAKTATIMVEGNGTGEAYFDDARLYYPDWYYYDQDDKLNYQQDVAGNTYFTYDNNGSLINTSFNNYALNYSYDFENRLTNISDGTNSAVYAYDGEGKRVKRQINTSTYKYIYDVVTPDGLPRVIAEIDTATNQMTKFLWGGGKIIGQYTPDGSVAFHHHDGLGSTRHLSSIWINPDNTIDGEVATTYDYSAFGKLTGITRTSGYDYNTSFLYTGEQYDAEATFNSGKGGFYYLRARHYDPYAGRFIERDKIIGDPLSPQTLNRYAYVGNNPLSFTDPSGLYALCQVSGHGRYTNGRPLTTNEAILISTFGLSFGAAFFYAGLVDSGIISASTMFRLAPAIQEAADRGYKFSGHALEKMEARKITAEQVKNVLQSQSFSYYHEGTWKTGYYDPASKIFVGRVGNKITTVINNVTPNYVRNKINARP